LPPADREPTAPTFIGENRSQFFALCGGPKCAGSVFSAVSYRPDALKGQALDCVKDISRPRTGNRPGGQMDADLADASPTQK